MADIMDVNGDQSEEDGSIALCVWGEQRCAGAYGMTRAWRRFLSLRDPAALTGRPGHPGGYTVIAAPASTMSVCPCTMSLKLEHR